MHTLQDAMLIPVNLDNSLAGGLTPSQENHASRPNFRDGIDDLLCEFLPAPVRVTVRFMRSNGQAGIQQQHTPVGPRCEEAAVLGRWLEGRVVFGNRDIDVLQGRRSSRRGTDGEAEAMSLVKVVIRILA